VVFASVPFLFYVLPLFFAVYFAAPGVRLKNLVLLVVSLLFYAWGQPRFVGVLVVQTALNYALALAIGAAQGRLRSAAITAGVAFNLALLGLFKYADFALGTFNAVLGADTFALPQLALPLGISFFTFHSISYLIDVHRGDVRPSRDPLATGVYITMFPQLVAGPIIRYHTIARALGDRRTTLGRASAGMRIFVIGLAQKVLIADEVARVAEAAFDKLAVPGFADAWLGLSAYTLQIYFDFAGYSNMAIGLGLTLGFAFPRNFRMPYRSRSITEFWRRWHISLSQWLRDYLYIPLGGSRGSTLETYRNLCLVFVLCGLWHGANWTFVIWGVHHGAFLIAERAGLSGVLRRAPAILAWAYAILAVMSGWVWFRAHDLAHAATYFASLAGLNGNALAIPMRQVMRPAMVVLMMAAAVLAIVPLRLPRWPARNAAPARNGLAAVVDEIGMIVLLALAVLSIAAGAYSPFLYFRF